MRHLTDSGQPSGFDFAREKNVEIFSYSYRVPRHDDYYRWIEDFKQRELIIEPHEFPRLPLRESGWDREADPLYRLSHQRDGMHGLVLQRLMQPSQEIVTMHLVFVSLANLGLSSGHCVRDLFQRSEEVGLVRCPYEALAVLSVIGPPIREREVIICVTESLRDHVYDRRYWDDKLLAISNVRHQTRFGYRMVYADPEIMIGSMDRNSGLVMGSPVHVHDPSTNFGWRFMFAIPEMMGGASQICLSQSERCLENILSTQLTETL